MRSALFLAAWLGLLAVAQAEAAPATAPSSAAILPNERPVEGSTEAELWYGMDQAEKEIRLSPLLVRDPALNAYVHSVACKVTGEYCSQLRVYLIDAPVFNAAMAPNGAMLVFTGALLRMHDEAELAVVLGHEFAHFRQRHSLKYWQKAKRTSALMATFSAMTYAGGVGLVGGLAQMAGVASIANVSRSGEREADQIGFQQALAQGYDPNAGVRVWTRMLREEQAIVARKPLPVFASHPRTEERLRDVTALANGMSAGDYQIHRDAYQAAMRPWLQSWLEAELSRRIYGASIRMITDSLALAPVTSKGTYTYYLAEAHRRQNKGDDRAQARILYAAAVAFPDVPADAWREQGMQLREDRQYPAAIAALQRYLTLKPQAPDRAFVQKYLAQMESTP